MKKNARMINDKLYKVLLACRTYLFSDDEYFLKATIKENRDELYKLKPIIRIKKIKINKFEDFEEFLVRIADELNEEENQCL